MKKQYPEFYQQEDQQYKKLWDKAVFVFDTNVLLNLYRYTETTRQDWLNVFGEIKDRVFLPYWVGYEYQKNRLRTIKEEKETHDKVLGTVKKEISKITEQLNKHRRFQALSKNFTENFQESKKIIEEEVSSYPDFESKDTIREFLDSIFVNNIGPALSVEDRLALVEEGKKRFASKIPPGFEDEKTKEGESIYSDYFIWTEIISYSQTNKLPIIFVTDDNKGDWWNIQSGKKLGPHPLLLTEFREKTGMDYHQYEPGNFLSYCKEYLKDQVSQESVKETGEISDQRRKDAHYKGLRAALEQLAQTETFKNQRNHGSLTNLLSGGSAIQTSPWTLSGLTEATTPTTTNSLSSIFEGLNADSSHYTRPPSGMSLDDIQRFLNPPKSNEDDSDEE